MQLAIARWSVRRKGDWKEIAKLKAKYSILDLPLPAASCMRCISEAQWPIGYGVGLRIKRSSVRIRPWPLRWVLGQGSLLPLSQGEAFTLASISYLAILVKYILANTSMPWGVGRKSFIPTPLSARSPNHVHHLARCARSVMIWRPALRAGEWNFKSRGPGSRRGFAQGQS